MAFPLCTRIPGVSLSSYMDTNPIGLASHPFIFKGPVSKCSHILRYWGFRTSLYGFGKGIISTCKYLGMTVPGRHLEVLLSALCTINGLGYKRRWIPGFLSETQIPLVAMSFGTWFSAMVNNSWKSSK